MYLNLVLLKTEFFFYIFNSKKQKSVERNNFFFVLDLSSFTSNYDITRYVIYLAIKSKYKKINIIIVPKMKIFDRTHTKEKNFEDINYFRSINIVYPILKLVKNFEPNIFFASSREDAYNFLGNNNSRILTNLKKSLERNLIFEKILFRYYNKKKHIPKLSSSNSHKEIIKKIISTRYENKKIITITLKKTSYKINENSNLEAWKEIAKDLALVGFKVVILRDFEQLIYEKPNNKIDHFEYFDTAIVDPNLRLALYESSFLNLGVCNGPFNSFIFFSDCNFLCFKGQLIKDQDYARRYGVNNKKIDFQLPFFNKNQKIIYENDDYINIKNSLILFFKKNSLKINF